MVTVTEHLGFGEQELQRLSAPNILNSLFKGYSFSAVGVHKIHPKEEQSSHQVKHVQ